MRAGSGLVALVGLFTAACGGARLENGQGSPEALARAVLEALAARDRGALERLALDEAEFKALVWPELPASRPERNLPFGYVWTDLRAKSASTLVQTLEARGGGAYRLAGVTFTGRTSQYDTFLVHRDALVDVVDAQGRRAALRLFGSVIEKHGRFKVFSYVVD